MGNTDKKKLLVILIAIVASLVVMSGCSASKTVNKDRSSQNATSPQVYSQIESTSVSDEAWMTWEEATAPNYVLVTGSASVDFVPKAGEIVYGDLDHLGRETYAVGNLTKATRDAGRANGREEFAEGEDPSGWPSNNPKAEIITPTGKAYNGYFWNRSHMIADSLGGAAIKKNAVTGTRMQNVGGNNGDDAGGMAFCEIRARDWLDRNPDGTLYYRADAKYVGDELVPRAVIVNMKSSDGEIDMNVIVYNAAKGYDIDYMVASFTAIGTEAASTGPVVEERNVPQVAEATEVYVTQSGKKYHLDPNCQGLAKAKEIIPTTLEDAQGRGLEACDLCVR